jgi:hypothetical protein
MLTHAYRLASSSNFLLEKCTWLEQESFSLPQSVGCPISRSFFARCGMPQRSTCFFLKVEKKVQVRGIPHLAKNERDMGHPTLCGREKETMGHP